MQCEEVQLAAQQETNITYCRPINDQHEERVDNYGGVCKYIGVDIRVNRGPL